MSAFKRSNLHKILLGKAYERQGRLQAAIDVYESLIDDDFDGHHPYARLANIYHQREDYENEIRVLKRAVTVFERKARRGRSDRSNKLEQFKTRLANVESRP